MAVPFEKNRLKNLGEPKKEEMGVVCLGLEAGTELWSAIRDCLVTALDLLLSILELQEDVNKNCMNFTELCKC